MTNYWNVYQTDLKSRLGKDYDENKAKQAWVQSKQYSNMNALDILQKSEDIYIDIAHSVRKEEQQNSKIKEEKKRRKVEESDNEWNKFRYNYKKKNPFSNLKEAREAYNGNVQNTKQIREEDRLKKHKKELATLKKETNSIPDFKNSLDSLFTGIAIKKGTSFSGGFGSERDTIRQGIDNIDKTCDDIYNSMVECYIEKIRTKVMKKNGYNNTNNNYSLVNNKIYLYVTDNSLIETMINRDIIPQSENRIGTLVESPESFLIIYKGFLKFMDTINKKSLAIKILKIFIVLGILGYGFKTTPVIEDFFTDGKNVYYFNLNNLKPLESKGTLFDNQQVFIEFRNTYSSIFSQGHDNDKDYYKFEDYDKDKASGFKQIIKDTVKHINVPTKTNYTPMYITGAILAALALVGINDVYRSFKKKPNEFSNR
jgi:hypothetical protein